MQSENRYIAEVRVLEVGLLEVTAIREFMLSDLVQDFARWAENNVGSYLGSMYNIIRDEVLPRYNIYIDDIGAEQAMHVASFEKVGSRVNIRFNLDTYLGQQLALLEYKPFSNR